MKKCLVTGASGFIGKALCRYLKEEGVEVVGLTRERVDNSYCLSVCADISKPIADDERFEGIDTVFHLAGKAHALSETAQDNAVYDAVNAQGTEYVFDLAKRVGAQRFIFFSSVKALGENTDVKLDETAKPEPVTPYGKSKLRAEEIVLNSGGVAHVSVLRLSPVYGPDSKGNLASMIRSIQKRRFIPFEKSDNTLSMIHVEDVVQAGCLCAMDARANRQIFMITDGVDYSPHQMVAWIYEMLGREMPCYYIPLWGLRLMGRIGDFISKIRTKRFFFDSSTVMKLYASSNYSNAKLVDLGFAPEYTLKDSLRDCF